MKQIYGIGLMIACLGYAILEAGGQSNIRTNATPQLQLTTEVVDARFCERNYLRLQLRLRYLNSGDQSVILNRRSNTIVTYFISRTIEDAEVEKYEQKYSPLQNPVGAFEVIDSETPNETIFVFLKPAASYEVLTQADFPFIFDGTNEDSDLLRPGTHFLRIRVQTWSEKQDVAARYRQRWRTQGYLWTRSVVSRPMKFDIPKHPEIVGCR